MKKILLTGATGYIGRRLKDVLLKEEGVRIRLLVRNAEKIPKSVRDMLEVVEGDTFDIKKLRQAVDGVDVAYYLIHSIGAKKDFRELDKISAQNFRDACIEAGVERIIYLGGLGDKETASKHLLSRIETGEVLSAKPDKIKTIWFRAGIIIGSGSASFEIVRNLVQKLPVMVTPKWVKTKTQPIAIGDVLSYLIAAMHVNVEGNLVVDIGAGKMSFKEMLLVTAEVMGLRRIIIPTPFLTTSLSSYWIIFFTPISYKLVSALVEGLKTETVKTNNNAAKYFPHIKPMSFKRALKAAFKDIEDVQVISRWCDSSAGEVCDVKYHDDISSAVYRNVKVMDFGQILPANVYKSVTLVGGELGWFTYHFLWATRGIVDKAVGGYGLNRGRRRHNELRVGDALDFWKVVDVKKDKRLLLFAQMRIPGKAWLEFVIEDHKLVQTAYFYPFGVAGRMYWYLLAPFHSLVFGDLAKNIIKRATDME